MFRVGDIITGNKESNKKYSYTNEKGVYKVIELEECDYITIEVIAHPIKFILGRRYMVQAKYFTKIIKSNYIGEDDEI